MNRPRCAPLLVVGMALGCLASGCHDDDVSPASESPLVEAVAPVGFPAGPVALAAPADNALTEERAELGRRLFKIRN